jgi:glycosyltransferase involved in cell wall biosynthesis
VSLISIIVPVYNNARSLADLLEKFQVIAAQNQDDTFEFIFVNDGSMDDSVSVLQELLHR